MEKVKMPAELKAKWLTALRSGEYAQCTTALSNGVGYCCLGVLQKVVSGTVEMDPIETDKYRGYPSDEWYAANKITLPCEDDHPFRGMQLNEIHSASGLNDRGWDFVAISNVIEEYVEGV